ncbi:deoxyribonuclease IV [Picrophilus oshimae]|uniref:Endonuclease IV n=1 Tax=Picrophilus torridus (strain ATCC 700027 / DSM 9790 / JCM 10055 / NBRC 100828 / KAW 2/3) TaxID=1122961 RepID=A0A8G2FXI3_PICTO|nr:deoxyribonuclease IV [Picrophilus oshimae]SMD31276.1 Endonuclease IV [Picrophilus oshimae DSM 9789]
MRILNYKLGAHISIGNGIENVPEIAHSMNFNAFQIFVKSRSWQEKEYKYDEIANFRNNVRKFNIEGTVAHAIYLINLASENEIRKKSINDLNNEIKICNDLGIDYLVVHPGSNPDRKKGIKMAIDAFQSMETGSTKILIENSSGRGNTFPSDINEMSDIIDPLDKKHFGLCLDTCHAYSYGYDLCKYDDFIYYMGKKLELSRINVIHLNDSKTEFASRKDLHENPGSGRIGSCLKSIFYDRNFKDSTFIMESPDIERSHEKNLNFLLGDNIED